MSIRLRPTTPEELARPSGNKRGLGIQQQAGGFAGTGGDDEGARINALLFPSGLVDVGNRFDLAAFVDDEFAGHGAGHKSEASGFFRGRNHDLAGTEVGRGDASAAALRAVVAGGTAVERLGQNRQPRGNAKNVQMVAGLLDDGFAAAGFGRRLKNSVGRAGNIFFGAENSDVRLDFVVVRRNVIVGERPVVALSVVGASLEIHRSHAQSDASPVVGASADDARAEPLKPGAGSGDVRLALDLPGAVGSEEFVFEAFAGAAADTGAAMRQVVRPHVFLVIALGNHGRPGLEQRDAQSALGKHFRGGASGGAGADDANVESFGRAPNLHESPEKKAVSRQLSA